MERPQQRNQPSRHCLQTYIVRQIFPSPPETKRCARVLENSKVIFLFAPDQRNTWLSKNLQNCVASGRKVAVGPTLYVHLLEAPDVKFPLSRQNGLASAVSLALPLELFYKNTYQAYPNRWTYIEDELFIPMRPDLKKDIGECVSAAAVPVNQAILAFRLHDPGKNHDPSKADTMECYTRV